MAWAEVGKFLFPKVAEGVWNKLTAEKPVHRYVNDLGNNEAFTLTIGNWHQDVLRYYDSHHNGTLVTISWNGKRARFVPTSSQYSITREGVKEVGGMSLKWE